MPLGEASRPDEATEPPVPALLWDEYFGLEAEEEVSLAVLTLFPLSLHAPRMTPCFWTPARLAACVLVEKATALSLTLVPQPLSHFRRE